MHGREQREGESSNRRSGGCGQQHMRSVPLSVTTRRIVVAGDSAIASVTSDSFCKDGRRISVGDCALFKPPHDSPPFIGIIRHLILSKESTLQLGVNWLYRPAELKLGKGILLDAAPNEVFYSFHRDEIPAASLLHPCKVAFLPKGVQLPTGISSFVCRRVYDITNKCLWWLTDQDYINDRQEEVDRLLYKTRLEMHASVQSGGRSPKPINGPTSASQLKPGSDNMPSNATPLPTQTKGKKRERLDQSSDSVKRERSAKPDDGDSGLCKTENSLKFEVSKITEKGGLVDSEGVEKLIQLMQLDRGERRIDLASRSVLAGVIAVTDRFDCLNRFVQLRGLPVLDEWLQDIHKGKVGDGGSPKDSDKSTDEFLLVLLRALDKLPINLQALQTWHIGKSVNHLRSHKNMEIQKKARSLVDTWKKRVEAEMNMIDAKSGFGSAHAVSWPTKSRLPEGAIKNPSGSCDVATRSSVTQISASKPAAVKPSQVETTAKSASSSPGPIKSASSPAAAKDGHSRNSAGATSDIPLIMREDKSSSSSQSHNYSQSFSGKEDARSSTAGSMSISKLSSSGSRHRKSINGYPGASVSGGQKETSSNRSSCLNRNPTSEKLSQSGLIGDKPLDVPVVEGGNHKLIVKIPNRGRSPAQSASGGSLEDPSVMGSRASSPVFSEKHDQFDRNLKEKSDALRSNITSDVNAESWQSNDFKDVLTGSDEGDGSPAGLLEEERSRTAEDARKLAEAPKAASSSSGNDLKSGKLREASFSSMNALIESCAKYSEANASIGDTVGMNLLASVATEEMSKSGLVSPADSAERGSPVVEELCTVDDGKSKSELEDNLARERSKRSDDTDSIKEKETAGRALRFEDRPNLSEHVKFSGDRKVLPSSSLESPTPECIAHINTSSADLQKNAEPCFEVDENADSSPPGSMVERISDGELNRKFPEEKGTFNDARSNFPPVIKLGASDNLVTENMSDTALAHVDNTIQKVENSSKELPFEGDHKTDLKKELDAANGLETAVVINSEFVERKDEEVQKLTRTSKDVTSEHVSGARTLGTDERNRECVKESERQSFNQDAKRIPGAKDQASVDASIAVSDQTREGTKVKDDNNVSELRSGGLPCKKDSPAFPSQDGGKEMELKESKFSGIAEGRTEECTSTAENASSLAVVGALSMVSKMKFDLNEGFVADEGKYGDQFNVTNPGGASTIHTISQLPFAVSSVSTSLHASITVAAAAKGPFVPLEDLLRSKREIGWKGSAATSAFRPAEPRKVPDLHPSSENITEPDVTGRRSRPPLEFDLNIPDERVYEDIPQGSALQICSTSGPENIHDVPHNELSASASFRNSGGLDLDLNRVDEASDAGHCSVSGRVEGAAPVKSASSGSLPTGEFRRDFDLNNGPNVDEPGSEQPSFSQSVRGSMHLQPSVAGLRLNNPEQGIFSSWFTSANTYSTVTIPSILPERGDQHFPIIPPGAPQRILGSAAPPFTPDIFRGSVLSSSSVMPFQSGPFQYPVFPFGTTFPLPSAIPGGSVTYMDSSSAGRPFAPPMNSQLLGHIGGVSPQYPRPFLVSLPDSNANSLVESHRKWGKQGLDLNAGPGGLDVEGREDILSMTSRQLPVASSQALVEEQARMFSATGGVLKRKEPEGGWDSENFRFKQSSWQ